MTPQDDLDDWIDGAVCRQADALERLAAAALAQNQGGIRVWRWTATVYNGRRRETIPTMVAQIDPTVPNGEIHEHPYGEPAPDPLPATGPTEFGS